MTIAEAFAARDTAARCQHSRSGSIYRYIRPTSPAMRVLFDALFVGIDRKGSEP